eukprot:CAMPEP_0185575166 /NCGR_PEP_ID=MMETSP0434-20130131/6437_1 /TAXON_ID=626734 ORGANISM="Favella taraikaensis, Strain Fe Narragansett Bay" /NCGR_SAMPLE_ID=MMETSP0434 /ASSEMBLY_ACC=CAM_ASM_000379 /LENGTH=100 /DNA_ID=CAMNT_0028191969 /DNA_START=59 /DNA_END=361 /DNA_ORIENTATION=-
MSAVDAASTAAKCTSELFIDLSQLGSSQFLLLKPVLLYHPFRLGWQIVAEFDQELVCVVSMLGYCLDKLIQDGLLGHEDHIRRFFRVERVLIIKVVVVGE